MKLQGPGHSITLLVWLLVMIGLVAGIVSNGLIGWTLSGLDRERELLLEQASHLAQTAQHLRLLGQRAQNLSSDLLQLDQPPTAAPFPEAEFQAQLEELRVTAGGDQAEDLLAELREAGHRLHAVWEQATRWRQQFTPVDRDRRHKQTLTRVRDLLQHLRAALEMAEGQQRLQQALLLRQWRRARAAQTGGADAMATAILEGRTRPWAREFNEIKTELVDLSRLVEMLAGETQLDQLADLRDNQLKPSLERLERLLALLRDDAPPGAAELTPATVDALKNALFGQGHAIVQEYQTIRPGRGGLYQLASDTLLLLRRREALQAETIAAYRRFEAVYPRLVNLTGARGETLARQAEAKLAHRSSNLLLLSLCTLAGFLGLGWLISRMARRQLDALARLRRQNELILNSAGEGIIGLDPAGTTMFINPSAARQLGVPATELLGRPHHDYLHHSFGDGSPCAREESPIFQTLRQGRPQRLDNEVFWRGDGSSFPVEYSATPICDERHEIEGAVVTFLDISERKAAQLTLQQYCDRLARQEDQLHLLNRDLEKMVIERTLLLEEKSRQLIATREDLVRAEKLAAIGALAAGVAHEINNPTAIIRGNVELLLMNLPTAFPGQEEAAEILRQTERISLITQNMLAFARDQQPSGQALALNPLLEEILDQAGHLVPLGTVQVFRQFDPGLPPVAGDAERLRQVFTNILVNALQATGGRGIVTVSSRREGPWVLVAVGDTGPGVPRELRDKIFDPFFTTKANGTGLGLSVSYGIVQAHGGTIEVESPLSGGATFVVRLPAT